MAEQDSHDAAEVTQEAQPKPGLAGGPLLYAAAGIAAGLISTAVLVFFFPFLELPPNLQNVAATDVEATRLQEAMIETLSFYNSAVALGVCGAVLGFLLGFAEGFARKGAVYALAGGIRTSFFATVAGLGSGLVGQFMVNNLNGAAGLDITEATALAHVAGWGVVGLFLGMGLGAGTGRLSVVAATAVTAAIGAALGAGLYTPVVALAFQQVKTSQMVPWETPAQFLWCTLAATFTGIIVGVTKPKSKPA